MNISLDPERLQLDHLQLQDRLSRLIPVQLCCLVYRKRYTVILVASQEMPARRLSKSAEHIAHQLVQKLGARPAEVDFLQYQPGEEPEWLRWRFQWVGMSPLKGECIAVNEASRSRYLEPLLSGGQPFSLLNGEVPAVA
ncbi:hypothetical protein HBA55_10965 [Pseudomaricurvus alkylphenolicus]|jgi:hypothetical protein|uniref:hypothetical protein n=1 Tax=Pseudomaricurvus alkylphenolicus TaxID=1306991 RepID=UPI001422CAD4|nr:hypothetical protein [Pseudomaricurvus alkylphenolicus]NIB40111.1 hypothetical protein [Pseudomaricurvus alkylphenolicus]